MGDHGGLVAALAALPLRAGGGVRSLSPGRLLAAVKRRLALRLFAALVTAAVLSLPQVAAMTEVAVPTAAALVVGLLLPLSGDNAPLGRALLQAAQMALFEVGPDDFALIVRDTGGSDDAAERAARDAIAAGAQLLLGPESVREIGL